MKTTGIIMFVLLLNWSFLRAGETSAPIPSVHPNQKAAIKAPVLIEVEVRFIEFEQDAMEKLGVEWMISDESDGAVSNTSNQEKRDKAKRNASSANVPPAGAVPFSMSSVLTDAELSIILPTLKQGDGINVLAAPKVTTESGKEAEIKVVEEVRYPVKYEIQRVVQDKKTGTISLLSSNSTASASNKVMTVLGISEFETRETGVILNVTPVLEADGKTISLTMNPQVVELVSWVDYGYTAKYADGSPLEVKMLQPIFHNRSLNTQISIYDGQTVVMGGLITEFQQTTEDEIQFFGKIPLLGKLFQKKTTKKVKRNLLIMVTARKKPN